MPRPSGSSRVVVCSIIVGVLLEHTRSPTPESRGRTSAVGVRSRERVRGRGGRTPRRAGLRGRAGTGSPPFGADRSGGEHQVEGAFLGRGDGAVGEHFVGAV